MRKCANCSECFYDENDNHLYCRANGAWNCIDDEKEFTEEPIWCPMKKAITQDKSGGEYTVKVKQKAT